MTRPWAGDRGPWSGKYGKEESPRARARAGRPRGTDMQPHTYALGVDLGRSIGVCLVRDEQDVKRPDAIEVMDLGLMRLPVDPKQKDEHAIRALVHSPAAWESMRAQFRELLLSSFSFAHRREQSHFIVAYEKVDFARGVYWAQLYGGITATLLGVLSEEVLRLGNADATSILPVSVSTAKKFLTGDPGASKARMINSFGRYDLTMSASLRLRLQGYGKESHNVVDAFAVAAYALQQAIEQESRAAV